MCAGFEDLYSFAFIGNSGRIGTASDGLFSYVPAGPNKQVDMFLRAYDLRKEGRLEVRAFMLAQAASGTSMSQSSAAHSVIQNSESEGRYSMLVVRMMLSWHGTMLCMLCVARI